MNFSKLWEIVKDREGRSAIGSQRVRHNLITDQQQQNRYPNVIQSSWKLPQEASLDCLNTCWKSSLHFPFLVRITTCNYLPVLYSFLSKGNINGRNSGMATSPLEHKGYCSTLEGSGNLETNFWVKKWMNEWMSTWLSERASYSMFGNPAWN